MPWNKGSQLPIISMKWSQITMRQYADLQEIVSGKEDEVAKMGRIIMTLTGKTYHQTDSLGARRLSNIILRVSTLMNTKPLGRAQNRVKWHRIEYDVNKMRFGNFVEIQHFAKMELWRSAHLILASAVKGNDSKKHSKYANEFLDAKFLDVYFSAFQILENIKRQNKDFEPPKDMETQDQDSEGDSNTFESHFGWIYAGTKIAEHRRIALNEVWDLETRSARNDLTYLRCLDEHNEKLIEDAKRRSKISE